MKIGIIAAMPEEIDLLLAHIQGGTEEQFGGFRYHTGWIQGVRVAVLQSGIGKVNAAVGTACCSININRTALLIQANYLIYNKNIIGVTKRQSGQI